MINSSEDAGDPGHTIMVPSLKGNIDATADSLDNSEAFVPHQQQTYKPSALSDTVADDSNVDIEQNEDVVVDKQIIEDAVLPDSNGPGDRPTLKAGLLDVASPSDP